MASMNRKNTYSMKPSTVAMWATDGTKDKEIINELLNGQLYWILEYEHLVRGSGSSDQVHSDQVHSNP